MKWITRIICANSEGLAEGEIRFSLLYSILEILLAV